MTPVESFFEMVHEIVHTYDDIIDEGSVTPERLHSMMEKALLGIPTNQFYLDNRALLQPMMTMALLNWRIANELEKGGQEKDLPIAYVIRSAYADIFTMASYIVNGFEKAVSCGVEIRREIHDEGFESYVKERTDHVRQSS